MNIRHYKALIYIGTFILLLGLVGVLLAGLKSAGSIRIRDATQESTKQALSRQVSLSIVQETANLQNPVVRKELQAQLLESPKLSNGSESNLVMHNPRFSPSGDKYIADTLINGRPVGLWLVSLFNGIEKQFIQDQSVLYSWSYDDNHITYSPWPTPAKNQSELPVPQPVFLLNLDSGESKEIGQTTLGWNVESVSTGDIAFLNGDTIFIVNPLTGVERQVHSALTIGHPFSPAPLVVTPDQTPEKLPDIFLTPPAPLVPDPAEPDRFPDGPASALAAAPDSETIGCLSPTCEVRFRISPDGKKLALQQIISRDTALVVVDIDTQKSTFITNQITDSWYPFGWSPDSKELAYAIIPEKTQMPELWVINVDGGDARQITVAKERRGAYDFVTWLPNQKDIFFIFRPLGGTNTNERGEAQIMSVAGGEPYTLFVGGEMLQVTKSGDRVFFNGISTLDGRSNYRTWSADLSY